MGSKPRETKGENDLLLDPIFTLTVGGSRVRANLPQVLALLTGSEPVEFCEARPHQLGPWMMFLAQLAAMASRRVKGWPASDEKAWRSALMALGEENKALWRLVVDDLASPAFLQPPTTLGEALWKNPRLDRAPDLRDTPIIAKNWDLKMGAMRHTGPEHWVYMLVNLQTTAGYNGARNYGTVRTKSGFSTRAWASIAPNLTNNGIFAHDVDVALRSRDTIAREHKMHSKHYLLWSVPWNGDESIPFADLDPLAIEICRLVRMQRNDQGALECLSKGTPKRRVDPPESGLSGDPWMPVQIREEGNIGWGIPTSGLTYRVIANLFWGDKILRAPMQRMSSKDEPCPFLLIRGICRDEGDNGNTAGFHERVLQVPNRLSTEWENETVQARIAGRVQKQVTMAAAMRLKILKPALCMLLQNAPTKIDLQDPRVDPGLASLEVKIDGRFFESVWENEGRSEAEAEASWAAELIAIGHEVLSDAATTMAASQVVRIKSLAAAKGMFFGLAKKNFSPDDKAGPSSSPSPSTPRPSTPTP